MHQVEGHPGAHRKPAYPFEGLPRLPDPDKKNWPPPPTQQECFALWQKYNMLENVRRHSQLVAHIAALLAERARTLGIEVNVEATRAAGLLHDIAKTWCLKYGGSHAMIGASWTVTETRNFAVAQGVILHVHWPWKLPKNSAICCLPIFVLYADKRVRHDQCVTLQERFEDLIERYGKNRAARRNIRKSNEQAQLIEANLARQLRMNLDENTFDCGRLV